MRIWIPAPIRRIRHEWRFFRTRRWENLYLGVFEDFGSARDFASTHGTESGYVIDQRQWLAEHADLWPHDYPMLFWLSRIIGPDDRVFDLGGSIGASYFAFQRVFGFPEGVRWQVCELPDVVAEGRELAARRGETALEFTADLSAVDGAAILFTAGALQFVEPTLAEILGRCERPPTHLLINRLPVGDQPRRFVTLQNTGASITPCRVENFAQLGRELAALGYREVDRWKCLQNSMHIPLHGELALKHFHGFYFLME